MAAPNPRPTLRPGVRVARRHDGRLQVGTGRDRVLVPDTPATREATAALGVGEPVPAHDPDLLAALSHLLVDRSDLLAVRHTDPVAAGGRAQVVADHGPRARRVLAARRFARVAVDGPDAWRSRAVALLADSGVGQHDRAAGDAGEPDLRLLTYLTEPGQGSQETVLRDGTIHLWVGAVAGRVRVGPFVDPGRTACRRCVAAHRSDAEPGWALVREQYAGPGAAPAEPCDPALMSLALAWAVRDVLTWLDGDPPSTWSATVGLHARAEPAVRRWTRHPACGCSWVGAWRAG